jgi:hypothetical protein
VRAKGADRGAAVDAVDGTEEPLRDLNTFFFCISVVPPAMGTATASRR